MSLSLLIILARRVKSRCAPAQPGQAPSVWPGDKSQAALGHTPASWGQEVEAGGSWWGEVSEKIHQSVKKAVGIWEAIEGEKGRMTHPGCSSSSSCSPSPLWEQMLRSLAGLVGATECVKRFKWLGLTQLNVNNSLFVYGWSFLRSAGAVSPTPTPIPYPPRPLRICCCSLKCESQLHGCCWMWKVRIMSVR